MCLAVFLFLKIYQTFSCLNLFAFVCLPVWNVLPLDFQESSCLLSWRYQFQHHLFVEACFGLLGSITPLPSHFPSLLFFFFWSPLDLTQANYFPHLFICLFIWSPPPKCMLHKSRGFVTTVDLVLGTWWTPSKYVLHLETSLHIISHFV